MPHAFLSMSGSSRWLKCTRAPRLESNFDDQAGPAAYEGTLAHRMAHDAMIPRKLNKLPLRDFNKIMKEIEADPIFGDDGYAAGQFKNMKGYMEIYSAFVVEQFNEAREHTPDARIYLEQTVSVQEYVPEGFGQLDVGILRDTLLKIIDLKYGKGVVVFAEDNSQIKLYALGAYLKYGLLYDIERVEMTIYQPRIDNITTAEISVEDLLKWADEDVKPLAELAFNGNGEFKPGEHCRFCKAKALCKANAEYQTQIDVYGFADPALLDDVSISDILTRASMFENWIEAVKEMALERALKGKSWPGFKVVEGRANRKYTSEKEILEMLVTKGYDKADITKTELLGITALTGELGSSDFNRLIDPYLIKPMGKPALAPLDDKRKPYDRTDEAKNVFDVLT